MRAHSVGAVRFDSSMERGVEPLGYPHLDGAAGDPGSAGGLGDGEALVQEIADDFEVFSRPGHALQTTKHTFDPRAQCTPVLTLAPVPQNEVIDHSPSNSLRVTGIIFNLLEEAV